MPPKKNDPLQTLKHVFGAAAWVAFEKAIPNWDPQLRDTNPSTLFGLMTNGKLTPTSAHICGAPAVLRGCVTKFRCG